MQDLVTLQVDTPVCVCRDLIEGLVCLNGQYSASLEERIVPYSVIYLYFGRVNGLYQTYGIVLGVANTHNDLIAYREKASYGSLDGIVIFYGVSNK